MEEKAMTFEELEAYACEKATEVEKKKREEELERTETVRKIIKMIIDEVARSGKAKIYIRNGGLFQGGVEIEGTKNISLKEVTEAADCISVLYSEYDDKKMESNFTFHRSETDSDQRDM